MAQAGIHGLLGMAFRKVGGRKEWLLLGILLGSLIPDMDNLGVAVATLAKFPTEGIHRTATHSLFFILALIVIFYPISLIVKQPRWNYLGVGLGSGVLLHIVLDVLLWLNGVAIIWPIPLWINLWANVTPPEWLMKFMDPAEFLFMALFLWALSAWARKAGTDSSFMKMLRFWLIVEIALFVIFTPLAYIMTKGFLTIFGAIYLFSLFMVFFVTIRMRKTVAAYG